MDLALNFYKHIYDINNYTVTENELISQVLYLKFAILKDKDIIEVFDLLKNIHFNKNELNVQYQVALIITSKFNNIKVIKELLKRDVTRDMKYNDGNTFMDYLTLENKQIICDYIEELDIVIIKPAKI